MGSFVRSNVRQAIVSYLQGAGITNLSTVYGFPPKLTKEGEFFAGQDPGHASGAVIYLWIEAQSEQRFALGGAHSGKKGIEYQFALDCYLRSTHKKSEDAGSDNDDFLDSLVSAIRADRNAGAPGLIFQWGEGNFPNGGRDIDIVSYYPRTLNGGAAATQVYSSVKVSVVEIVTS